MQKNTILATVLAVPLLLNLSTPTTVFANEDKITHIEDSTSTPIYISNSVTKLQDKLPNSLETVDKVQKEGLGTQSVTHYKNSILNSNNEIVRSNGEVLAKVVNGEIVSTVTNEQIGTWVTTIDGYGIVIEDKLVYSKENPLATLTVSLQGVTDNTNTLGKLTNNTITFSNGDKGKLVRTLSTKDSVILVNENNEPLYNVNLIQNTGYIKENSLYLSTNKKVGTIKNAIVYNDNKEEIGELMSAKGKSVVVNEIGIPFVVIEETPIEEVTTKVIKIENSIYISNGEKLGEVKNNKLFADNGKVTGTVSNANNKTIISSVDNTKNKLEIVSLPKLYISSNGQISTVEGNKNNKNIVGELLSDNTFFINNSHFLTNPISTKLIATDDKYVPTYEMVKDITLFPTTLTINNSILHEDISSLSMTDLSFPIAVNLYENYGKVDELKVFEQENLISTIKTTNQGIQTLPIELSKMKNTDRDLVIKGYVNGNEVLEKKVQLNYGKYISTETTDTSTTAVPPKSTTATPLKPSSTVSENKNKDLPQTNTENIVYLKLLGTTITLVGISLLLVNRFRKEKITM